MEDIMKVYEKKYYVESLCDIEEDVFDAINYLSAIDEEDRDAIRQDFDDGKGCYKVTVEYVEED